MSHSAIKRNAALAQYLQNAPFATIDRDRGTKMRIYDVEG